MSKLLPFLQTSSLNKYARGLNPVACMSLRSWPLPCVCVLVAYLALMTAWRHVCVNLTWEVDEEEEEEGMS